MWKAAGVFFYLLVLSIMDVREKKVNGALLIAGMLAAGLLVIWEMVQGERGWGEVMLKALLGMMPGAFLLAVARVTGKAGYADGMVLAALGICQGYLTGAAVLCISLLYLSLCSAVLLLCKRVKGNTKMPYLPFLTAAYVSIQLL